ncbi:MAG: hypothetical protein M1820_004583 [Bogoriella megaspora]|nr:MAG: hypothetical protein M1820_004583 [Bogoriella megaspora]
MSAFDDYDSITSADDVYYVSQSDYTYRVPTPPRVNVAPPGIDSDLNLSLRPANGDPSMEALTFLKEYGYQYTIKKDASYSWSYDKRYQAQEILPFLYLGPMMAVARRDFLQQEGITMLLAVRPVIEKQSTVFNRVLNVADELGLQKAAIDVGSTQELISFLPKAINMINEHIYLAHRQLSQQHSLNGYSKPSMGKVLVFCESGNEKSVAIILAYLMQMFADMDLTRAMQYVHTRRFCVNVDDNMRFLLTGYWDYLQAKWMVDASHTHQVANPESRTIPAPQASSGSGNRDFSRKRGFDVSMDEHDEDMDGQESETVPRGNAPFRDL